jgi:hypothetical protein
LFMLLVLVLSLGSLVVWFLHVTDELAHCC